MNFIHAIILSIVEGITEFLPISSTGHLILTSSLLKVPQTEFTKSFEIIIQFGAILAVIVLYWKSFIQNTKVWTRILAAFIPTGIIGFILYKFIKQFLLGNESVTLISLFVGGILLILIEYFHKEKQTDAGKIEQISLKNAVIIGLAQALAVIPGVSRAAATIISARLLGIKRETAVVFSFLLAVPTMAAATGFDLIKSNFSFTPYQIELLAVGFIGSFLVAILAVKFFLKFAQNHTFIPFGVYRIILALVFWLLIIR